MKELFEQILHALERGENVVLCSILASSGSAPRGAGAKMAVFPDGTALGTIGGGAVERIAAEQALELLRTGEYALLESGEFSWASLNFEKGRLAVEAAPAHARPEIAAGTLHGLRAKCNGTVLRTNLASGTMLVVPGQTVEAGQGLIGTARSERDGTLIFAPAAGTVVAQLEWETNQSIPLAETLPQLTGESKTNYRLFFAGHSAALSPSAPDGDGLCRTRHLQLEVFGLPLPCAVEETTYYGQRQEPLYRTEAQALTLARLQGLRALYDAFPDADILARRETCTVQEDTLHYNAVYTVAADICT